MAAKSDWRPGPSVCRCCFAEGCYKDISTEYFWMGKREVYSEMLNDTFDVTIAYSQSGGPNSNSRLICEPCIARLRDASDFKRQVQECERVFLQHLDPVSQTIDTPIEINIEPQKEVKLECVKVERKLSDDDDFDNTGFPVDDDDDDDDLDDEPLTKLASKVPKKESVDLMDLLDNSKPEKRKATLKIKASPSKKLKKKETPKPSVSKPPPPKTEKKKKDIDRWGVNAASRNGALILRHSTAYPFQVVTHSNSLCCCFCQNIYDDPKVFRAHFDIFHPNTDRSYIISDEYQTRVDITELKCNTCRGELYESFEPLVEHLNKEHDADIDVANGFGLIPLKLNKDHYECLHCREVFIGVLPLSRHMSTHYYKYICDVCARRFETAVGIEVHSVNCPHKHRCRKCQMSFKTAQEKLEHAKANYKCMSYKCYVCKVGFTNWDMQQKHLQEVHGKERVNKCSKCGVHCKSRMLLYQHFNMAHTDKYKCQYCNRRHSTRRQLDDHINAHLMLKPHKCHVCNKEFERHKSLSAHLKIHDDSKKFACQVCTKLFVTQRRMKEHVNKHHPGALE